MKKYLIRQEIENYRASMEDPMIFPMRAIGMFISTIVCLSTVLTYLETLPPSNWLVENWVTVATPFMDLFFVTEKGVRVSMENRSDSMSAAMCIAGIVAIADMSLGMIANAQREKAILELSKRLEE